AAFFLQELRVGIALALDRLNELEFERPQLHERLAYPDVFRVSPIVIDGIGTVRPFDELERSDTEYFPQERSGSIEILDHNSDLNGTLQGNAHTARYPPSTSRTMPVTMADASDARNSAGPTISSVSPIRPSGILDTHVSISFFGSNCGSSITLC